MPGFCVALEAREAVEQKKYFGTLVASLDLSAVAGWALGTLQGRSDSTPRRCCGFGHGEEIDTA